jgi:hypothetical protein
MIHWRTTGAYLQAVLLNTWNLRNLLLVGNKVAARLDRLQRQEMRDGRFVGESSKMKFVFALHVRKNS